MPTAAYSGFQNNVSSISHCLFPLVYMRKRTPTPAPEAVDFIVDEEAMGDLAERFVEITPTPESLEETPDPALLDEDDDVFPEDF